MASAANALPSDQRVAAYEGSRTGVREFLRAILPLVPPPEEGSPPKRGTGGPPAAPTTPNLPPPVSEPGGPARALAPGTLISSRTGQSEGVSDKGAVHLQMLLRYTLLAAVVLVVAGTSCLYWMEASIIVIAAFVGGFVVVAHVARAAVEIAFALRFERHHARARRQGRSPDGARSTPDPGELERLRSHIATLRSWDMQATEDGLGYYGALRTIEFEE